MAGGRSPNQEVSLYSQAIIGTGGEVGGGESTSEDDFRGVGGEGGVRSLRAIAKAFISGKDVV